MTTNQLISTLIGAIIGTPVGIFVAIKIIEQLEKWGKL